MKGEDLNMLLDLTVKTLSDRVIDSYSVAADFTTPDAEMLTRLVRDVWHFGCAKNYQEMRDLTIALKDEHGKLREFADYKEVAAGIIEKYNETWMKTEYNFAVSAAQNAARWVDFEKEADIIPNLMYQTAGDDHVRISHRALDGIIRPVNDSFWNTHYPPNGWGCRCEAVQSLEGYGNVTPDKNIPVVPIPDIFKTNLAKTGLIYPENHPYYHGVPKSEIRKALSYLPANNAYIDTVIGSNQIKIHPLHGEAELHSNLTVANDFMNINNKVKELRLLPDIHMKDAAIKEKFLPDGYKLRDIKKNPDTVIKFKDGSQWVADFKHMTGDGGRLAAHIKDAYLKADYAIIKLENPERTINQIMRTVNGQMNELRELKGIVILDKDGNLIYEKYR